MGQLNKSKQTEITINDFSGGYGGAKSIGNLSLNEADNLENLIILPSGSGFRNLEGTKQISPTGGSSHNIVDFLVGIIVGRGDIAGGGGSNTALNLIVLGAKSSDNDDVGVFLHFPDGGSISSGGLIHYTNGTITKDAIFSMFYFQDVVIVTSRLSGTIDGGVTTTPFKVDISGLGATSLQSGIAPNGKVGIGWNNRAWIGSTSADKSKLYYSILNDETDWNGSGSGFVNPDPNGADELTALAPISNNVLLYFKQDSIYQVVGRSDPFAIFELFRGIGCIGNQALVNVDNVIYFITPKGQMRITDGSRIYDDRDIPTLNSADDLWAQVPVNRRPLIRGVRHKGRDFDWIIWLVSLGSAQATNNQAIIWDLKNKCWLRATQGFSANTITTSPEGRTFLGSYDSIRAFEVAVASYFKDDTNSTDIYDGNNRLIAPTDSTTMAWKWRSDDYNLSLKYISQVTEVHALSKYSANGDIDLNYRYDGKADSSDITKAVVPASLNLTMQIWRPLGRGDTFGFELNSASEVSAQVSKITLVGVQKGTKDPGMV